MFGKVLRIPRKEIQTQYEFHKLQYEGNCSLCINQKSGFREKNY